eukprot:CAMPEP_0185850118 /NCGR_PEP_ID=MMETSP1354-20130828/4378_1 /TAXON_ID=708628 /ORGANISM="Erythrolobus madagascarensis, Strain CCMP3276" /LENGTH=347 /DNA_ID=CAMNT_0028550755 /DNA_START=118 /DNA_END=1161 /DNA_ORIENTATION=-
MDKDGCSELKNKTSSVTSCKSLSDDEELNECFVTNEQAMENASDESSSLEESPCSAAVDAYKALLIEFDILVVVYFRSDWCPVCHFWMKRWSAIHDFARRLELINAGLLFVSSGNQQAVEEVENIHGFATSAFSKRVRFMSDPLNTLARFHARTNVINVHTVPIGAGMARVSPAFAVMGSDGQTLASWALQPTTFGLLSRVARPDPVKVWAELEECVLKREFGGKEGGQEEEDGRRVGRRGIRTTGSSSYELHTIYEEEEEDEEEDEEEEDLDSAEQRGDGCGVVEEACDGVCVGLECFDVVKAARAKRQVDLSSATGKRTFSVEPESMVYLTEMLSSVLPKASGTS